MALYIILSILLFAQLRYNQKDDLCSSLFAVLLFSAVFMFYSLAHSIGYCGKYTETVPLNISKIAINDEEYWIYTEEGEVLKTFNPKLSDSPSAKILNLTPQKWWFINLPVDPETYNLNIDDLHEKRIVGVINKIE